MQQRNKRRNNSKKVKKVPMNKPLMASKRE